MTSHSLFTNLVVTYNSANVIPYLLRDLQLRAPAPPNRVIVIDNASKDQTAEIIRAQYPQVRLVVNSQNLGFARAVNQGFELCETERVFLFNPDVRILDPRFFSAMLDCLEQGPRIAAVGPLQFKQTGGKRRLNFTWSYLSPKAFRVFLSHTLRLGERPDAPIPTTFLNAGCLLLRKSVFEQVGRMNEKYFLYGEEPDLFLKFVRYGYECRLHLGAEVLHARESSLKTLPRSQRYFTRLRALFNISDALVQGVVRILKAKLSYQR